MIVSKPIQFVALLWIVQMKESQARGHVCFDASQLISLPALMSLIISRHSGKRLRRLLHLN